MLPLLSFRTPLESHSCWVHQKGRRPEFGGAGGSPPPPPVHRTSLAVSGCLERADSYTLCDLGKHVHFLDLAQDFLSIKWGDNNSFSVVLRQWFLQGREERARGFCTLASSSPLRAPSKTFGAVSRLPQLGNGVGILSVKTRDMAEHPAVHRTAQQREGSTFCAPNPNSAEAENPVLG